jgi:cyclopropane-fatty-acyl-phospholipid synthase
MKLTEAASFLAERLPVPDALIRAGISGMVQRTDRTLGAGAQVANENGAPGPLPEAFARSMDNYPIAIHTDAANAQHYELPSGFFELVLGPRMKYSSCYFEPGDHELDAAELHALQRTVANAGLANGQRILELGCGWGSLSLYMAETFPQAQITAVSNSHSQRAHIEAMAMAHGLSNLTVITCDMNDLETDQRYDRVVSVEMFEHMANWRALLTKVRSWLTPSGRVFIHVFTHSAAPYRFDAADKEDWIAQHFFTGGIMPSHGLMHCFPDLFDVESEWRWCGTHYARTARAWLGNFDRNSGAIMPLLRETYGADAQLWKRRWRMFFLATEGLFGHAGGKSWGVSQYCLAPACVAE